MSNKPRISCPKYHHVVSKTRTTSTIWSYFGLPADENGKKISKDIAICNLCEVPVSTKNGTTSNIRQHLKIYHPDEYKTL